jgi:hypothetical protein
MSELGTPVDCRCLLSLHQTIKSCHDNFVPTKVHLDEDMPAGEQPAPEGEPRMIPVLTRTPDALPVTCEVVKQLFEAED